MQALQNPKATRSTLQNRRLNQAIRAHQLHETEGLKIVARRSVLPRAHRADVALAVTGGLLITLFTILTLAL